MLIIQDPFGIFKRSLFWFKIAFFPLGSFLPFWPFRLLGPRWGSRPKGTSVFGAIFLLCSSKNFNSFKKTFGVRAVKTGSRFLLPLKSCWWRHLSKWWRHHWQKRKFIILVVAQSRSKRLMIQRSWVLILLGTKFHISFFFPSSLALSDQLPKNSSQGIKRAQGDSARWNVALVKLVNPYKRKNGS